jgi:fido (protein-threonine AMPylation protein)
MPNMPDEDLKEIEDVVGRYPEGTTAQQIADALKASIPRRTLQYRLKHLVDAKRLTQQSSGRWAKYRLSAPREVPAALASQGEAPVPISPAAREIQIYLHQPLTGRKPVGYKREFLNSYRPNVTAYLSPAERTHLHDIGKPGTGDQPAGTYAKQILNRLLIDLSWNSSRLEGNTYSLLDTKRLINFGEQAQGKAQRDAQMILNHKDAIEFLVSSAEDVGFNRYTILNLHALLANNLLGDPTAAGSLRHIGVGIEGSTFHPLEIPQLIDECFNQILATATAITDPFEQAFFVMVQMPYLQPFDDVNKRVSRLAANIPLIKGNLSPLSFTEVPRPTYTDAMLGVYELNKVDLLKDVFIWAYERSAARYAAVRQSLGEPDPFRLRYRVDIRDLIGEVVRGRMDRKSATAHVAARIRGYIDPNDRDRLREVVEDELLGLHEGNFARYQIRPSEFSEWQNVWTHKSTDDQRTVDITH